jgi:hypothetical protein
MKDCAEITINLSIGDYDPVVLLKEIVGAALQVELDRENVWIEAHSTDDPLFPSFISAIWDETKLYLGQYAEIEIARRLHRAKNINAIVSHYGLISGLDSENPFWCLLHEGGQWFLGDTSESMLEFTNGSPGVIKRGKLDFSCLLEGRYIWDQEKDMIKCQHGAG